jgi:hypothetical protein
MTIIFQWLCFCCTLHFFTKYIYGNQWIEIRAYNISREVIVIIMSEDDSLLGYCAVYKLFCTLPSSINILNHDITISERLSFISFLLCRKVYFS